MNDSVGSVFSNEALPIGFPTYRMPIVGGQGFGLGAIGCGLAPSLAEADPEPHVPVRRR